MKIVIYGSSGFVGRYVVEALKDHNLILPLRGLEKREKMFSSPERLRFVPLNTESVGDVITQYRPEVVVNLVGILKESPEKDITFEKVHFEFSRELIDAAKKSGVVKFVQMSALGADIKARSRYLKTKAMAEEYLINSGLSYIIFRPSIILGREQRLFGDIKRYAKIAPFFLAPVDAKVQPVHVLDVADSFKRVVEDDSIKNQIFELCGNRMINFKELFEFGLLFTDINRAVIGVPKKFFLPLLPFFSILSDPIMTFDQYYMLDRDNVCSKKFNGVRDLLGKARDAFMI